MLPQKVHDQWLLYLQDEVVDVPFWWLLYLQDEVVDVPFWLSYAISKIYNI